MAFEQEIVVKTIADDSGLISSFENTNDLISETNQNAEQLSSTLDKTFSQRDTKGFETGLSSTNSQLAKQDTQLKKNTRSFGSFNRNAGRGISTLSRFTGIGGRATRSLSGLAVGLAGTPFGAFAIAASAASFAYSFFTETVSKESDDIIKKNKELRDSVASLEADLTSAFQEGKILQLDLQNLTEGDKILKEVQIRTSTIAKLNESLIKLNKEQIELENELSAIGNKNTKEGLELQKRVLTIGKERQQIATNIAREQLKIFNIGKEQEAQAKAANDAREKRAIDTEKLFESLIRDELEKRLVALDRQAEKRDEQAKKTIDDQRKLNNFLLNSAVILEQDKQKAIKKFADAEAKTRLDLMSQLATDEESLAKQNAQLAFSARGDIIKNLSKTTNAERASLEVENEKKLQEDLLLITNEFAEKRKEEQLKKDSEIFAIKSAAIEAEALRERSLLATQQELERQEFAQQARTEEEITEFQKEQNDVKLKQELDFQIARLELARSFNKELNDQQKAALDAQIESLKTQLSGLGTELQAEVQGGRSLEGGLFGLLGFSENQASQIQAVQGALEQVTSAVSQAVAERVKLLEQEVQERENAIDSLEKDLDREIKLRELGKASSIRGVQEQLEAEKAARDKAEREKQEAARAQFALDTALQASNLITAISGLYQSLSGLPFGIGVALATALSGVLIGSFVASKAQAAQVSGFEKGGGVKGGEQLIRINEKGEEFVIDASTTKSLGLDGGSTMGDFHKKLDGLGGHSSDNIPNYKTISKKTKSINRKIDYAKEVQQQNRQNAYSRGIKEHFESQNVILNKVHKSIENMPVVIPMSEDKVLIKKGNNNNLITIKK